MKLSTATLPILVTSGLVLATSLVQSQPASPVINRGNLAAAVGSGSAVTRDAGDDLVTRNSSLELAGLLSEVLEELEERFDEADDEAVGARAQHPQGRSRGWRHNKPHHKAPATHKSTHKRPTGFSTFTRMGGLGPFRAKLGLPYASDMSKFPEFAKSPAIGWTFNWAAHPYADMPDDGVKYCPMLWGYKNLADFITHVSSQPEAAQNKGKCVLAMNEVNLDGQGAIGVQDACHLMRSYILPLKLQHGYYIMAPSTTNAPSGKSWMKSFRSQCPDVWEHIDASAIHVYSQDVNYVKKYLADWHAEFGKPLMVTELGAHNFAGSNHLDKNGVKGFMRDIVSWAMQEDSVHGIGWTGTGYGLGDNNRIADYAGNPNDLFQTFTGTAIAWFSNFFQSNGGSKK